MVANRRRMRNRSLHEALRAFTEQAALTLDAQKHAGAEVPFEVVESPGARTALYCYQPLTSAFIGERADTLEALSAPGRELYLVLGADAVANMPTWRRLDETRHLATIVVVNRPAFRSFVLGLLDHAEILEPDALRNDLLAWIAPVAEHA